MGTASFTYDGYNRLASSQTAAETTTYTYNALGERMKKANQNGLSTVFHYGTNGELLWEKDQAGNTKAYVWLNGRPLARIDNDAQIYYYHVDHLGTPQAMTNSAGTVVWKADYEPFGKATVRINTVENNLRLPGQYFDRETGMHYNYYRSAYNPGTGRYEEADPIGLDGGLNIYSYANQNPLTFIDPLGLTGCYVGYPGYPITIPGTSTQVPLTHAGVLSYDSQGHTRYYEYGRYDSDFGDVHRRTVPDLDIGPDGKPTPESWAKLQDALNKIGHGTKAKTSCEDKADADKINKFAEQRMHDRNRAPYSWNPFNLNTCTTFASDALGTGLK